MKSAVLLSISALTGALAASSAEATVITIDQGTAYSANYDNGGMGQGRGVSFLADETFSISSVGLNLSVPSANSTVYQYQIFSSVDGHTAGSLLASTDFTLSAGNGFRDQPLAFTFNAGSYYAVNFARKDGSRLDPLGTLYVWELLDGVSAAVDYGPFTVVEGFEGSPPNNGNPLIAQTRFTIGAAVPEPATWAMMIGGFGLVGGAMRRRVKAVHFA